MNIYLHLKGFNSDESLFIWPRWILLFLSVTPPCSAVASCLTEVMKQHPNFQNNKKGKQQQDIEVSELLRCRALPFLHAAHFCSRPACEAYV